MGFASWLILKIEFKLTALLAGAVMRWIWVALVFGWITAFSVSHAAEAPAAVQSCQAYSSYIGLICLPDGLLSAECKNGFSDEGIAACTSDLARVSAKDRYWVLLVRSGYYTKSKRIAESTADLVEVMQHRPDMAAPYLGRALNRIFSKDVDGSRADFEEALKRDPEAYMAHIGLSYIYAFKGDPVARDAEMKTALTMKLSAADAYFSRADYLYSLHKYDLAFADLEKALAIEPNHIKALGLHAVILAASHRADMARSECARVERLAPDSGKAAFCYGFTAQWGGEFEEAITQYSKAIAQDARNPSLWQNRASVYLMQNRYAEAAADLDHAIALNPNSADQYSNRGIARHHLGQDDIALADYAKAIELNPFDASTYLNRGALYLYRQEFAAAEADFKKALDITPDNAAAQEGLMNARRGISGTPPKPSGMQLH